MSLSAWHTWRRINIWLSCIIASWKRRIRRRIISWRISSFPSFLVDKGRGWMCLRKTLMLSFFCRRRLRHGLSRILSKGLLKRSGLRSFRPVKLGLLPLKWLTLSFCSSSSQHGAIAVRSVWVHVGKEERKHQGNLTDQQADQQDLAGVLQNVRRGPRHLKNRSNPRVVRALHQVLPALSGNRQPATINLLRPRL